MLNVHCPLRANSDATCSSVLRDLKNKQNNYLRRYHRNGERSVELEVSIRELLEQRMAFMNTMEQIYVAHKRDPNFQRFLEQQEVSDEDAAQYPEFVKFMSAMRDILKVSKGGNAKAD